jgi:hypothetical protein
MKLVRNINSTYIEVNRNLKILEKEGVITDKHVGRLRIIKLNRENPKTELLLQALRILSTQPETKNNSGLQSSLQWNNLTQYPNVNNL